MSKIQPKVETKRSAKPERKQEVKNRIVYHCPRCFTYHKVEPTRGSTRIVESLCLECCGINEIELEIEIFQLQIIAYHK